MPRTSKRQLILESAAAIINEKGADYLTLDAVAQRAGISKGGLFYHFKRRKTRNFTYKFDFILRFNFNSSIN